MPLTERFQPKKHKYTISMSASANTTAMETEMYEKAIVAAVWSGADATDATVQLEVSHNGTDWNNLGGTDARATLNAAADSQMWLLTDISYNYLRAVYSAGSNTAGSLELRVELMP